MQKNVKSFLNSGLYKKVAGWILPLGYSLPNPGLHVFQ